MARLSLPLAGFCALACRCRSLAFVGSPVASARSRGARSLCLLAFRCRSLACPFPSRRKPLHGPPARPHIWLRSLASRQRTRAMPIVTKPTLRAITPTLRTLTLAAALATTLAATPASAALNAFLKIGGTPPPHHRVRARRAQGLDRGNQLVMGHQQRAQGLGWLDQWPQGLGRHHQGPRRAAPRRWRTPRQGPLPVDRLPRRRRRPRRHAR